MSKTILLKVSDSGIRGAICEALESEGYFVLAASEIDRAARWVKECTPDLLMVRHYTESMSGHDAAVYLRSLCPGIPVLLVGGILNDPDLGDRESLLNFEVFPKPYKAVELLGKVKEVLSKHPPRSKETSSV